MFFHGLIDSVNAALAQVAARFDCTHAVFTLLAKPKVKYGLIFGTNFVLNDISGVTEPLKM